MNKITKKEALSLLSGKVQFIGSYWHVDSTFVNNYLENNFRNQVIPYLEKADIRECVKLTQTQIKFKLPNNEYSWLTQLTNSKWYLNIIEDKKFVFIEGKDNCTVCYHIL